jgi:hypothetical protein
VPRHRRQRCLPVGQLAERVRWRSDAPPNVTALCCCLSNQNSGIEFDTTLFEALYGKADFNKDGVVDLDEVIKYYGCRPAIRSMCRRARPTAPNDGFGAGWLMVPSIAFSLFFPSQSSYGIPLIVDTSTRKTNIGISCRNYRDDKYLGRRSILGRQRRSQSSLGRPSVKPGFQEVVWQRRLHTTYARSWRGN